MGRRPTPLSDTSALCEEILRAFPYIDALLNSVYRGAYCADLGTLRLMLEAEG
jgi:hypothetical protein